MNVRTRRPLPPSHSNAPLRAPARAVSRPSALVRAQSGAFTAGDLLALQRSLGNQQVMRLVAASSAGAPIMRKGAAGAKRRAAARARARQSGAGGSGSTALVTIPKTSTALTTVPPPQPKIVRIPVTEAAVKESPELVATAEDTGNSETVASVAGGILDVWEGLETATNSEKSGVERAGGGAKAVGGATVLGTTGAKTVGALSASTESLTGVVSEAMGFLSSAAECYAAVREALDKGAYNAMYALAGTVGGVLGGALKAAEAYAKYSETSETFKAWIGDGVIPGVSIVTSAVKGMQKFYELYQLSQNRNELKQKIKNYRDRAIIANSQHLIALMDSKWYKGAIEIVATLGDLIGEFMKWSAAGIGTITGAMVGAGSKLLPLGAKVFNYIWQTANDWGGTAIWGGKTTAEIEGSTDALADMIVARSGTAFGKLLCKVSGIDSAKANDRAEVLKALAAFA